MSKKKRPAGKKHNISPSHLSGVVVKETPNALPKAISNSTINSNTDVDSTAFVGLEVRKVLALASIFIAVELVLWVLFTHTGLGQAVYQAIKP